MRGKMMTESIDRRERNRRTNGKGVAHGIVIANGHPASDPDLPAPRITAFIWGGKVRPPPTLPFGKWKGAA